MKNLLKIITVLCTTAFLQAGYTYRSNEMTNIHPKYGTMKYRGLESPTGAPVAAQRPIRYKTLKGGGYDESYMEDMGGGTHEGLISHRKWNESRKLNKNRMAEEDIIAGGAGYNYTNDDSGGGIGQITKYLEDEKKVSAEEARAKGAKEGKLISPRRKHEIRKAEAQMTEEDISGGGEANNTNDDKNGGGQYMNKNDDNNNNDYSATEEMKEDPLDEDMKKSEDEMYTGGGYDDRDNNMNGGGDVSNDDDEYSTEEMETKEDIATGGGRYQNDDY